jgi:hypothetical protein
MRLLAEEDEYANQCDEQWFVALIKWSVDEYALRIWCVHTTFAAVRDLEREDRSVFPAARMTNLTAASARRASRGVILSEEAISDALAF